MARGERSDDVWAWYTAVYEAIQEIPYGRVTSYGHIARLVGKPQCSRQVGICLKHLPEPSPDPDKKSATYHSANVPWQRVINSRAGISPRGPEGATRQADALRAEGVEVKQNAMGEYTIDLGKFGWFPDVLPSESGDIGSGDDEGGDGDEDDEEARDAAAYHA